MNIYSKIKLVANGKIPGWMKLLGLSLLLICRRRMIGVFIDTVGGCNLRCRMCYFSDAEKRKTLGGKMSNEEIERAAKSLFPRALKLQIGCGTEPTLDNRLPQIIREGKEAGIPYISLTTNGQLIADGHINIEELCAAGLNEITLSMHGTQQKTLEYLMVGASFEKHCKLIAILEEMRRKYPSFTIRINFTINSLNVTDLADDSFWNLWKTSKGPDVVQLRPVQKIGESEWSDFSLDKIRELYPQTIGKIAAECAERGVTFIGPTREQLDEVVTNQDSTSSIIEDITYCYISSDKMYKSDFSADDTFTSYHKRHRTASYLIKSIFKGVSRKKNVSKKLNYNITK